MKFVTLLNIYGLTVPTFIAFYNFTRWMDENKWYNKFRWILWVSLLVQLVESVWFYLLFLFPTYRDRPRQRDTNDRTHTVSLKNITFNEIKLIQLLCLWLVWKVKTNPQIKKSSAKNTHKFHSTISVWISQFYREKGKECRSMFEFFVSRSESENSVENFSNMWTECKQQKK